MSEAILVVEKRLSDLRKDYIGGIEAKLVRIEDQWQGIQQGFDREQINTIIRSVHKFSGSGGMYGFNAISEAARNLEMVLVEISKGGDRPALDQTVEGEIHMGVLGNAIRASIAEFRGEEA